MIVPLGGQRSGQRNGFDELALNDVEPKEALHYQDGHFCWQRFSEE